MTEKKKATKLAKALRRLERRQRGYDNLSDADKRGRRRPGSMNRKKS